MQLLDLPAPEVFEVFDFETLKKRRVDRVVAIMEEKGIKYIPNESDDIITAIEMTCYEDILLFTQMNNRVKAQLLYFAKGVDLDHIAATRFGVVRLEGTKPYTEFTFSLSTTLTYSVTLPKGLQLSDGKGVFSKLLEDVVIASGETTVKGVVELQLYAETSDVKTEIIITPLPYVVTATQSGAFANGAYAEDDERFRERVWLSRERKSTAGSVLMYEYYAKTADARVSDVKVISNSAGVVEVYLLSTDGAVDSVMIDRVSLALNEESVRPLTDSVVVSAANVISAKIEANIVLYDLTYEADVRMLIENRIKENTLIFGKTLTLPKIYGLLESAMVRDIALVNPTAAINCADNEVIDVTSLTLNFSEAV